MSSAPASHGQCSRCGDANPKTAVMCRGCGSRLPWADPAPNKPAAPLATGSAPNLPVRPGAPPQPGSKHLGPAKTAPPKDNNAAMEAAMEWIIPIGGVLVVGVLAYVFFVLNAGGTWGRGMMIIPLGLVARFIVNKIVGD